MLYMFKTDEGYMVSRKPIYDYILLTSNECSCYLNEEGKMYGWIKVSIRPEFKKTIEDMFANSPQKVGKELWGLEKRIFEAYENKPHFPLFPEGDSDAYQEKLEWNWYIQDLNEEYQEAQSRMNKALRRNIKIKSAYEYYKKQKDFEDTVAYYKKHHINGF